jgi:formylglycine-generating enzyme required for sulfatase activity
MAESDLIVVPAGPFTMGCDARPDEKPTHVVVLEEYRIARTHTTNRAFSRFVDETGYVTAAEREDWAYTFTGSSWGNVAGADWRHPEGPHSNVRDRMDHPVLNVTWFDALAYCGWLSEDQKVAHRLPTEAEWEKAARGGHILAGGEANPVPERQFPWGNVPPTSRHCNFEWYLGGRTSVGAYSPTGDSPYGCHDMAGNAWEWCYDEYLPYPYRQPQSVQLAGDANTSVDILRCVRGGSWHEDKWVCRVPGRGRTNAEFRDCYLTFRTVTTG